MHRRPHRVDEKGEHEAHDQTFATAGSARRHEAVT
jgi:hypothetical protein